MKEEGTSKTATSYYLIEDLHSVYSAIIKSCVSVWQIRSIYIPWLDDDDVLNKDTLRHLAILGIIIVK